MGDNPYTAEVVLTGASGVPYTLVYNWRARAAIKAAGGGDPDKLLRAMVSDVEAMAQVLLAGMKAKHPDMTVDKIMDAGFFTLPAADAINRALAYSIWGPGGPDKDETRDPPAAPAPTA